MRERAAQKLNPKMGCMGAEDPSRAFPAGPLVLGLVFGFAGIRMPQDLEATFR